MSIESEDFHLITFTEIRKVAEIIKHKFASLGYVEYITDLIGQALDIIWTQVKANTARIILLTGITSDLNTRLTGIETKIQNGTIGGTDTALTTRVNTLESKVDRNTSNLGIVKSKVDELSEKIKDSSNLDYNIMTPVDENGNPVLESWMMDAVDENGNKVGDSVIADYYWDISASE